MDYTKEDIYTVDLGNLNCNISASTTTMSFSNYSNDTATIDLTDDTIWPNANVSMTGLGPNAYIGSNLNADFGNLTISNPLWPDRDGKLSLQGDNADIEINGESLMGMLRNMQDRLNMLQPNKALEAEWDQLRELGEQYRTLEKKLTEQSQMWDTLKKMPPPEIK